MEEGEERKREAGRDRTKEEERKMSTVLHWYQWRETKRMFVQKYDIPARPSGESYQSISL